MSGRAMTVAGVMSGTSADGIDVAIVRIAPANRTAPKIKLLAHEAFPYPAALRRKVLAAMNAVAISTAELARLNWRLGMAYSEAVRAIAAAYKLRLDLVGCHGQTLYHQSQQQMYAGRKLACTWQAGEAQAIAALLHVPVVANFRPADMLAGGKGAPLVPLLDYALFAHARRGRVLQNVGGIANLTAIPGGATPDKLIAFDTGPGNMIIDWLALKLFNRPFDRNGALAAKGTVIQPVLAEALRHSYFQLKPPRTAGREQFGREYAERFLNSCRQHSRNPNDALSTATALTAGSIARSYKRFVSPRMKKQPVDFVVSGGGAKNKTLMTMLAAQLEHTGCNVMASDELGMPVAAKEAVAFALLAWNTWNRMPGNLPSATGAKKAVILGQITYA